MASTRTGSWVCDVKYSATKPMIKPPMVPMAAQAAGMNFEALCWRLLELTMEDAS